MIVRVCMPYIRELEDNYYLDDNESFWWYGGKGGDIPEGVIVSEAEWYKYRNTLLYVLELPDDILETANHHKGSGYVYTKVEVDNAGHFNS